MKFYVIFAIDDLTNELFKNVLAELIFETFDRLNDGLIVNKNDYRCVKILFNDFQNESQIHELKKYIISIDQKNEISKISIK